MDKYYDFTVDSIENRKLRGEKSKNIREEYLNLFENGKVKDDKIIDMYIMYKRLINKGWKIDPDNYSSKQKEIYKEKFENLEYCKDEKGIILSDTMTSVQNLINTYINTKGKYTKNSKFGIGIMIDLEGEEYKKFKNDIKFMEEFIKRYHTIGNYIPVPDGFNTSRSGKYGSHDTWDLTLSKIKKYYDKRQEENENIELKGSLSIITDLLFCENTINSTKRWLDSFKNFEDFVDKNYLKAYVDVKDGKYDISEKFKKFNRTWEKPFPENFDFEGYIKVLVNAIDERADDMLEKDNKKSI